MDENELRTLFREAPGEPPAAGFDAEHVAARSRRLTARRRMGIAAGASSVVLVLAGAGLLGVGLDMDPFETAPNAGSSAVDAQRDSGTEFGGAEQPAQPSERQPDEAPAQGFPDSSPKQGGEGSGEDGPRAESTSGCDQVDRELVTALADELPVTAQPKPVVSRLCGAGWRSAGVAVRDGTVSGQISVVVLPAGSTLSLAPQPQGSERASHTTGGGGTVWVLSTPAPEAGTAPYAGSVDSLAAALAARF
ncbi:hypothetical protein [Amycolatopsis cihanbeyliensis]|uniref:Uncharacterized protein n=1 Tax=Amycolatopsis cihanbeyliensis TaxID=1128664 RepID=A0A542DKG1_AMYCI|nr:hypothetical protein [Amycolatopsis cihanbeyliensis]TQJ03581.1 hypothetical protein FB471_3343 [Amycolatopsis cihanbeyliensis]